MSAFVVAIGCKPDIASCIAHVRLCPKRTWATRPFQNTGADCYHCFSEPRGRQMRRREFITLVGGTAVAWPLAVRAHQAGRLPTIGFLGVDALVWGPWTAAFVGRLRELGWIEGRTIAIEYRWAEGRPERYAEFAAEFVRLKVDVIVTFGTAVSHSKAGNNGHPHCLCSSARSDRRRLSYKSGAPRRQRHWTIAPGDRRCCQAAP